MLKYDIEMDRPVRSLFSLYHLSLSFYIVQIDNFCFRDVMANTFYVNDILKFLN